MFKFLERMPPWGIDAIGATLIIVGLLGYIPGPIHIPILTDAFLDIRSELIGIGVTVILIDNANEILRTNEEKKRLILQMGSPDNAFAVEAVRQLRERGWLTDGSIKSANLCKANLQNADLEGANLESADLEGANLQEAILTTAILLGGGLFEANLQDAKLQFALLLGADLQKANLRGANLQKASLAKANLRFAYLRGANLEGADLFGANLDGAYLEDANLQGAGLFLANLQGAYLFGANLREANLQEAKVIDEHLALATSLEGATMPDGNVYDPAIHTKIAELRSRAGLKP